MKTMMIDDKSADPGLSQGRGGAWDHRRCGTSPSSLSTAKPILQPSSHINSFCRLPALKPSKLHPAANRHPPPQINRRATHQWLLVATLAVNRHPRDPAANRHPAPQINRRTTHQWLLMGVHVCRLPALKRSKRSKPLKPSKPTHLAAIKPYQ